MVNLGWAKAKMKENNKWTFGYLFRHDKFGDGHEVNTYLVSTAEGGFLEERQLYILLKMQLFAQKQLCHQC